MSVWRQRARDLIAKLTADLPVDATVAERRRALWGNGYPAHSGTMWGRRMWGSEVRKYLARHGEIRIRNSKGQTSFIFDGPPPPQWPDHVHFPFREGDHG